MFNTKNKRYSTRVLYILITLLSTLWVAMSSSNASDIAESKIPFDGLYLVREEQKAGIEYNIKSVRIQRGKILHRKKIATIGLHYTLSISPDARFVVYRTQSGIDNNELSVYDVKRNKSYFVLVKETHDGFGAWSPDGMILPAYNYVYN